MDTPTIAAYYREKDAMKRKELLEQSIAAGEEPEANAIRQEIWNVRYQERTDNGSGRADGFIGLWMVMEFNKGAHNKLFGARGAVKEIRRKLDQLKFAELCAKSSLHEELMYRECCHMVRVYIELCQKDKSYGSTLFGVMSLGDERVKNKLRLDLEETGIQLPEGIGMTEELSLIMRAVREMYQIYFPGE